MVITTNSYSQFAVSNFDRSIAFYDAVLAQLGYWRCNNMKVDGRRAAEYCYDESLKVLSILEVPDYSEAVTKLFSAKYTLEAKNQGAIDSFYATAIANGARDYSKPKLQTDKSYAASVLDPDGHHIEAVYHQRDD